MSSLAISVENVSKVYRLGEINRGQFFSDVRRWVKGRLNPDHTFGDPETEAAQEPRAEDLFYALRNVSFDIAQGETVGIIGANGAGKSTLLKLISRITVPSTGSIKINGRVGSLLEVGTGFHPDLTGRDNVFMNGAILGMNRKEVVAKFDDIISFSGVSKFIDTPVKRYSSGMFVRLAFSVAVFLEPEILIVDEVLSVGDLQFQNRCLKRLRELIKDGRTVIFVSHGAGQIRSLCSRAICLQKGEIICDDKPNAALDFYQIAVRESSSSENANPQNQEEENKGEVTYKEAQQPGDAVVRVTSFRVINEKGEVINKVLTSQGFAVQIQYEVYSEGHYLRPACIVADELGNIIFWSADTSSSHHELPTTKGIYNTQIEIPGHFLSPGKHDFNMEIGAAGESHHTHASTNPPIYVIVEEDLNDTIIRGAYKGPVAGFIRPKLDWKTNIQLQETAD